MAHDIKWVAVKAGDGNVIWTQFRRAVGLKEFGLKVFSWSYNYGAGDEAQPVIRALDAGADGHIFDIEAEFASRPNSAARACDLISAVKERYPNAPLAYAPLPVIDNFPGLPYMMLNSFGMPALPQFYTKALGTGADYPLTRLMAIWERWQGKWAIQAPAIHPVLQGYGGQTADNLRAEARECMECFGGFSVWRWGDALTPAMWEAIRDA